jgi:hypothetical protein
VTSIYFDFIPRDSMIAQRITYIYNLPFMLLRQLVHLNQIANA